MFFKWSPDHRGYQHQSYRDFVLFNYLIRPIVLGISDDTGLMRLIKKRSEQQSRRATLVIVWGNEEMFLMCTVNVNTTAPLLKKNKLASMQSVLAWVGTGTVTVCLSEFFDATLINVSPASLLFWDKNNTFCSLRLPLWDKNKIPFHFLLRLGSFLNQRAAERNGVEPQDWRETEGSQKRHRGSNKNGETEE